MHHLLSPPCPVASFFDSPASSKIRTVPQRHGNEICCPQHSHLQIHTALIGDFCGFSFLTTTGAAGLPIFLSCFFANCSLARRCCGVWTYGAIFWHQHTFALHGGCLLSVVNTRRFVRAMVRERMVRTWTTPAHGGWFLALTILNVESDACRSESMVRQQRQVKMCKLCYMCAV
jgi:hypothetical protein